MNHSIVFIHGSGDSAYIWRLQIEHFGTDRAFAIDLPGHGQRANTLPDEVGVLDYARSVLAIITGELHLDHPIGRSSITGTGRGCNQCCQYAWHIDK